MKFPFTIQIGTLAIPLHAVMEFLAFFVGFRYYLWLRKRQGDAISTDNRVWIIIGAIFGALVGSRLVGGLESISQLQAASNKFGHFYGNKSVVGGFVGGLFGVEGIKSYLGERQRSGDLFVYPMILAMIIGRIGCFSMGVHEDVVGIRSNGWWAMDLGDGIKRHPLMLYEIIFLVLLWFGLRMLQQRRQLQSGMLFKFFLIAYLLFRFCIEYMKARETYLFGWGSIQITCVIGLTYYALTSIPGKKRKMTNTTCL